MSKRYIGEEWSDDDTDGCSLSGSPPKRRKSLEECEKKESSERGFISRTFNRFYSSVNNLIKGFNLSSDEQRMSCESVRSHSSLGMNQTNSYSHDFRSDQSVVGSNHFILTPIPSPTHNYVIHTVIQSPSANMSTPMLSPMPIQLISANTSPNSLVLLSTNNMDPSLKCVHCGQVSTSPITNCRHCGSLRSKPNTSRGNAPSPIEEHRFYQIQNTGVGRARARMQMSNSLMNVTPIRNINKPLITNIRSLSNTNNSFASKQRLHQLLNPKESKKPEVIELDAENVEKRSQRISQSSDECIEIMDSNGNEEDSEVGVQCDFNSETIELKTQSFEENPNLSISKPQITANNSEESLKEMTSLPDYAMFGTYKTTPKTIEFTSDGIKLTNVSPNSKDTKFKYHIMIPFIEMQELFYCSNDSKNNYLFIKPTSESNHKIQESMYLGLQSPNGLKFDISSKESREHYIIVVLRDKISERFAKLLTNCCKRKNVDIKCNQIEDCLAKHMLNSSTSRPPPNVQHINSSNQNPFRTPPRTPNLLPVNNRSRNIFRTPDSSDTSPSPLKLSQSSRRSFTRTPVQTVIIDIDDDDEEGIIDAKEESESEFDKVIFSYPEDDKDAIHLVGTDIKCLNKGEFLNDNIVNFYLRYFFNEKMSEEERKRTHIFDTLFFMQLTEKRPAKRKSSLGREEQYTFEQRYEQKLKKWTKNVEIFSKDFLVFPIIRESHWFLSIVCYHSAVNTLEQTSDTNSIKVKSENMEEVAEESQHFIKKPCIIFMDSLGTASYKKQLSAPIRDFLAQEWKSKHKSELSFKTAKVMRDISPPVPNQTNSSDCGVFVLEYVEQFIKRADELATKVYHNKNAIVDWFDNHLVKPKRQEIRALILSKVSVQVRERLETLIDDTKLSDCEDNDEIGMEVMNTSNDFKGSSSEEKSL